jgi:HSP20 family protein
MKLTRWDPVRDLESLSNRLNQVFGQTIRPDEAPVFADWTPSMDVEETDTEYLVKTDLPDLKKEDVKVAIQDGVLSLEGERKQEKEEKTKKYHRVERSYGTFVRRLSVPADVDQQKVQAEFKDGVLTVHMPKSASAKPRSIDVTVA